MILRALSPYKAAGLRAAYDVRLETFADNAAISTLTDQSGNGLHLTSSGSNRPVCKTNIINGNRVARFTRSSSHYLVAASAADWKFLSNGNGFTAIQVWRSGAAGTSTFWDTGGYFGTQIGCAHNYDSSTGTISAGLTRGVSGAVSTSSTDAWAVMPGQWATIVRRWKYSPVYTPMFLAADVDTMWVNGVLAGRGPLLQAPSQSNPTSALYVNRYYVPGAEDPLYGDADLAALYFFNLALDHDTMTAIGYWIEDTFAVYYATHMATDGYYNSFGDIARNPTTKIITYGYRKANQHLNDKGKLVARNTANGRDWTEERLVYDAPSAGDEPRGFNASYLSDGKLYVGMTIATIGSTTFVPSVLVGTKNGISWAAPVTITNHGLTGWAFCEARMVEPDPVGAPGTIYTTVYGMLTAGTFEIVKLMKSTNYGATWSLVGTVANGPSVSKNFSECAIDFLSSTKIIAFVREDDSASLYYVKSTDTGVTWGTPVQMTSPAAYNVPYVVTLASGRKLMCLRQTSGQSRAAIYWSTDSANDYGNVTTSWHGPYYPDARNGFQERQHVTEIATGIVLSGLSSELTSQVNPVTPPGATACFARVMRIKESDIALT